MLSNKFFALQCERYNVLCQINRLLNNDGAVVQDSTAQTIIS